MNKQQYHAADSRIRYAMRKCSVHQSRHAFYVAARRAIGREITSREAEALAKSWLDVDILAVREYCGRTLFMKQEIK